MKYKIHSIRKQFLDLKFNAILLKYLILTIILITMVEGIKMSLILKTLL